jgi:hypothetical protein
LSYQRTPSIVNAAAMPTIISHKNKFIFIHVPKVAGTSIARSLAPYEDRHWLKKNARRVIRRALPPAKAGRVLARLAIGILPASDLKRLIPGFDDYFTFSFVRNPWDLHVSFYHYLCRDRFHPQHKLVRNMSFEEYVRNRRVLRSFQQHPYVTDSQGRVMIDFLGRYETLTDDFAAICSKIGITPTLPHLNKSDRRDYQSYYTDETREIIATLCRRDIELFDYSF